MDKKISNKGRKIQIVILIVLLLVILAAVILYFYQSNNVMLQPYSECHDGDEIRCDSNGQCEKISVEGQSVVGSSAWIKNNNPSSTGPPSYDSCIDSNTVSEAVCDGDRVSSVSVSCPLGTECTQLSSGFSACKSSE